MECRNLAIFSFWDWEGDSRVKMVRAALAREMRMLNNVG
jgi:hypothetical protein